MKPVLFAALISCFSVAAYAACTDSQQQCVIYKNGNVATEGGCSINKCQNADAQVLKWKLKNGKGVTVEIGKNGKVLVNKKPGAKANNSNAAGMGLTCYAADADKREQLVLFDQLLIQDWHEKGRLKPESVFRRPFV